MAQQDIQQNIEKWHLLSVHQPKSAIRSHVPKFSRFCCWFYTEISMKILKEMEGVKIKKEVPSGCLAGDVDHTSLGETLSLVKQPLHI